MTRIAQALSRTAVTVAMTVALAAFASTAAHAGTPAAGIRIEPVSFSSGGHTLKGHLYIPAGVSRTQPGRAAVVTGAWMTIKEQMAGRYARELAERGIVALAFDFRGWGESGGTLRAMEDPKAKTDDIRAAVAFLATRADVDPQAISGLGICASAGYMAQAAATTPALRSVAFVAPWLHDRAIVNAVYGGEASVQSLIDLARQAQARFKATGQQTLVPAASSTDKTAVMFNVPYYTERDRGLIPQWENRFNVASWDAWLGFDAMPAAARLKAPLLMVHSDAAAIPQGARQFYAAVTAPKQQLWLEQVTQFDFYDRAGPVTRAADAVAQHFKAAAPAAPL
jgi:dienelactone hydrolase